MCKTDRQGGRARNWPGGHSCIEPGAPQSKWGRGGAPLTNRITPHRVGPKEDYLGGHLPLGFSRPPIPSIKTLKSDGSPWESEPRRPRHGPSCLTMGQELRGCVPSTGTWGGVQKGLLWNWDWDQEEQSKTGQNSHCNATEPRAVSAKETRACLGLEQEDRGHLRTL